MKKLTAFFTLFTSLSTLFCCALPAAFVLLGLGSTFASLSAQFPQMIWLAEHKSELFIFSTITLALVGILRFKNRNEACDINQKEACDTTRDWSGVIYWVAFALYLLGAFVSYILPILMKSLPS